MIPSRCSGLGRDQMRAFISPEWIGWGRAGGAVTSCTRRNGDDRANAQRADDGNHQAPERSEVAVARSVVMVSPFIESPCFRRGTNDDIHNSRMLKQNVQTRCSTRRTYAARSAPGRIWSSAGRRSNVAPMSAAPRSARRQPDRPGAPRFCVLNTERGLVETPAYFADCSGVGENLPARSWRRHPQIIYGGAHRRQQTRGAGDCQRPSLDAAPTVRYSISDRTGLIATVRPHDRKCERILLEASL